jgi:hypothetical protein
VTVILDLSFVRSQVQCIHERGQVLCQETQKVKDLCGWGGSSVVERILSMYETLASQKTKQKNPEGFLEHLKLHIFRS